MKRLATILFLGLCAFLGGMAASLTPKLTSQASAQLSIPQARLTSSKDLQTLELAFENVAERAGPSVVTVDARKTAPPGRRQQSLEESGSGVIVQLGERKDLFVITNNHVVENAKASQITLSLSNGQLLIPERVWTDPESDIALLLLPQSSNVKSAPLGNSDRLRIGQWVVAIGSPFGLNQTVTHGILSARGRGAVSLGETIRIKDFLQTDAAINPGSSGGPLFNLNGEVIGINTAIASSSGSNSGVAFSIPVNLVKAVAEELLKKGKVSRGYLGLQLTSSFDADDALKLGLRRVQGAWIDTIYENTPAADAGLRINDVVLEVDGTLIKNPNHFINLISGYRPNQRVRLVVWREQRRVNLTAVIGDWDKFRERIDEKE